MRKTEIVVAPVMLVGNLLLRKSYLLAAHPIDATKSLNPILLANKETRKPICRLLRARITISAAVRRKW
jgi:hypothetical protein